MSLSATLQPLRGPSSPEILVSQQRNLNPDSSRTPLGALSRYRLSCLLGRGGMAEVFLAAWQVAPEVVRPVVVKRLYAHFSEDSSLVEMFIDEARLVCQLDHENIVKTYEVGLLDGRVCIAMEYLEGQTIQQLLRRCWDRGGIPVATAVYIAMKALSALWYAHQATDQRGQAIDVVHRDISPHNLFLTNAGQVKVLDFGIAKAKLFEQRTATGVVKGKLAYVAPEQACGHAVDGRADVWSLGVVLWEMLAGKRLFRADGDAATLNATLRREVPLLSEVRPDVPAALAVAVCRSLQRDPDKRYESAEAMLHDLERCLEQMGVRPDASTLSDLMRHHFAEEITQQRQLVNDLLLHHASIPGAAAQETTMSNLALLRGASDPTEVDLVVQQLRRNQKSTIAIVVAIGVIVLMVGLWVVRTAPQQNQPETATLPRAPVVANGLAVTPASTAPPAVAAPVVSAVPALPMVVAPTAPTSTTGEAPEKVTTAPAPANRRYAGTPQNARSRAAPRSQPEATAPSRTLEAVPAAPAETSAAVEFGYLTLDTTPWANVSADGKLLGTTPLIRVRLASGSHVLTLNNPDLSLTTKYTVTISANQTLVKRIGLK